MNNRLKEVREEKGLSQVELSKKSGVCRPVIIKIEHGELSEVKVSTLERIAGALDEPVGNIFFN